MKPGQAAEQNGLLIAMELASTERAQQRFALRVVGAFAVSAAPALIAKLTRFAIDFIHKAMYTVHMIELRFEWDEDKNRENIRKHGISFEEAQAAFLDEHAVRFLDPDHSEDEDRFIMLGMSFKLRVLVVCHCFRKDDTVIRIISARKADKRETKNYRR